MVVVHKATHIGQRAQARHHFSQRRFEVPVVNGDKAYKILARVGLLVFKVVVGLEGADTAAHHQGGESQATAVDGTDGLRGDNQSGHIGEQEMYHQQEQERSVVAAIGDNFVVDHQHEEDNHYSYQGSHQGLDQFFQAGSAQHIAVGAQYGV